MSLLTRIFSADRGSHYARGIVHYNRGEYAAALAEFEQVLAECGGDRNPYRGLGAFYAAETRTHLGLVRMRTGDYAGAEREFLQAIADNPGYPDRHYNVGLVRERLGDRLGAAQAFRTALGLNPDFHEARAHLALALAGCGDHEGARAELAYVAARGFDLPPEVREAAFSLTPASVTALRARLESESRYDCHLEEAAERYQRGDVTGAAEELARAAALRPTWADVQCRLGVILAEIGRHEEALAALERAVAINPGYAEAQLHRGRALLVLGRPAQAAAALEKALVAFPESPDVLGPLATAHARAGRPQRAAEVARAALAQDEQCADAREALALAHLVDGRLTDADALAETGSTPDRAALALAAGRPREAVRLLEQECHRRDGAESATPEEELLLGHARQALGEEDDARAHFERASRAAPGWWPPRMALARLLLQAGDHGGALAAIGAELESTTDNAALLTLAGDCHRLLERPERALALYDRALKKAPACEAALLGRALCLRSLGRDEEALASLRAALRADPLNVVARRLLAAEGEAEEGLRRAA